MKVDLQIMVQEIRAYVKEGDHEAAHTVDDRLKDKALRAIADGHPEAVQLAKITQHGIEYKRW